MAEREGFEPPERFPVQRFSRPPPSTTRPSLRGSILRAKLVCNVDRKGMGFAKSCAGVCGLARKQTARGCRCDDLEARLARVEQLAQSYRRELDIQFRRIADLQAMVDSPIANGRRKERRKPPN